MALQPPHVLELINCQFERQSGGECYSLGRNIFWLGCMPYATGKGIRYLITRKLRYGISFQKKRIFFSAKSQFSFLFGVFPALLSTRANISNTGLGAGNLKCLLMCWGVGFGGFGGAHQNLKFKK